MENEPEGGICAGRASRGGWNAISQARKRIELGNSGRCKVYQVGQCHRIHVDTGGPVTIYETSPVTRFAHLHTKHCTRALMTKARRGRTLAGTGRAPRRGHPLNPHSETCLWGPCTALGTLGMADILSWNFMPRINAQNPGSTFFWPCEGFLPIRVLTPLRFDVPSTCPSWPRFFLSGLVKPSHCYLLWACRPVVTRG